MLVLCLACAACGGDDDAAADASVGGSDAAAADATAPPGVVLVRVLEDGDGVQAVTVAIQGPDGALLGDRITDGNGEARFTDPPAGAMVSALFRSVEAPTLEVRTIVGVEAGDVIVIGAPAAPAETPVDVRVDYPGGFGSADIYLSHLGCDFFGQADPDAIQTREVGESCLGSDGDYDALAVAREGTTQLAFATVRDVAPAASGPTDIVLPAWEAAETRELTIDNLPGEVTETDIDLRSVLDGTTRWPAPAAGDVFTVPGEAQVDGWYALATVGAFAGPDARTWAWRQVLAADTPSPHALDFADFGPRFDTLAMDPTDEARPIFSWTSSAATTSLGAVVLVASWTDTATAPQTTHRWTVVLPPGTETATLPALPGPADEFRRTATAYNQVLQVLGFWYARHADYAAFRNDQPFALGDAFVDGRPEEARMLRYQQQIPD